MDNVIQFPKSPVRPAAQTSGSSSPWMAVVLIIGGIAVWEGIQYAFRPAQYRRNPRRRRHHRRAA